MGMQYKLSWTVGPDQQVWNYLRCTASGEVYVAALAGSGLVSTEYTEDAASAANPIGGMLIARRRDTLVTNEVTTDGDNIALNATNKGELRVSDAALTAGPGAGSASLSVVPSTDQNPILDHTNGTKASVTSSATIITTGAGHTFLDISTDVDIVVNSAGAAAVDDGTAIRIIANQPRIIPVPPSTAIKALSLAGAATVRCTPLKVR